MSRVNVGQMKKLLDLLSQEGVLVNGNVDYMTTNKQSFWKQIAIQLNAVEGGAYKNGWKWCKMWADWKNKVRKKANIILRRKNYSMENPTPKLTNLELRLLKMIDYPIDDNGDLLRLETGINKIEMPVVTEESPLDYFIDEDAASQSNKAKLSSEDNEDIEYMDMTERKPFDLDEQTNDDIKTSEEDSDTEKNTLKGGKLKKKNSLEECKFKSSIALEKEKSQHRTEELRLRALELKIKGEELRLKEMEMNKINYLTTIEEEKLKCFREISSSLKELVERSRNGNLRFSNII